MRWWGPAHAHYGMTDAQSLLISVAMTLLVVLVLVSACMLVARHKRRVRMALDAGKSLPVGEESSARAQARPA